MGRVHQDASKTQPHNQPHPSKKMSLETTLRYENGKILIDKSNLIKQQERIRFNESNDRRIQHLKLNQRNHLKAEWAEDMQTNRNIALWKENRHSIKKEVHNAHNALLKVRRAKLKEILLEEQRVEAEKLCASGFVKYSSRL